MDDFQITPTVSNLLVSYDVENKIFQYPEQFHDFFAENPINRKEIRDKIHKCSELSCLHAESEEVELTDNNSMEAYYRIDYVVAEPKKKILVIFTNINDVVNYKNHLIRLAEIDELTGLYTKDAFKRHADKVTGPYAILYFDVWHFKAINDYFGKAGGDLLLINISELLNRLLKGKGFAGRLIADRFIVLLYTDKVNVEEFIEGFLKELSNYDLAFHILCNVGIYVNTEELIPISAKIDRASIAQAKIKGNFSKHFNYFKSKMSADLVNEQAIVANMSTSLEQGQFVLYFQPQFSHITEKIVGAEALVRWVHPELGVIPPNQFIPVFEKNNFITVLDMYVFEQACVFIRKSLDEGIPVVPVSTNFSRYDVVQKDFVEKLEDIRQRHNVPIDKIRIEITESAVVEGADYISDVVQKLQKAGYVVEMDDFGSGYSSLNVLKDINFDILKLDMKFMTEDASCNDRSSTILSSVVGMSARLHMSIIAEGVETGTQADFLRDIGCEVIQGYLYSKPIPEDDYVLKLKENFAK